MYLLSIPMAMMDRWVKHVNSFSKVAVVIFYIPLLTQYNNLVLLKCINS